MRFAALGEAGPLLDRRITRRILGRRNNAESPRYSTEEAAADALTARLTREGLTATFEQEDGSWYCVFWLPRPGDEAKERIATGSGETRPLALCRAVLNLPLEGTADGPRLRASTPGWIGSPADEPGSAPSVSARRGRGRRSAVDTVEKEPSWLIADPESAGKRPGRKGSGS